MRILAARVRLAGDGAGGGAGAGAGAGGASAGAGSAAATGGASARRATVSIVCAALPSRSTTSRAPSAAPRDVCSSRVARSKPKWPANFFSREPALTALPAGSVASSDRCFDPSVRRASRGSAATINTRIGSTIPLGCSRRPAAKVSDAPMTMEQLERHQ